jgi:hypothetical protein
VLGELPPVVARATRISLVLFGIALVGLLFDHREITGAPAWLKPAKFGFSSAVYLFTLGWMVKDLPRTRALRIATSLLGWILVVEVIAINVQVLRGTTSHFNVDTPLDVAIFSAMGIGIGIVWLMSMVLLWLHLRTEASDRAMAAALRIGLALNILGAGTGWTMTQIRPAQLQSIRRGEHPFIAGSHTVGAPDGGPGLPIVKWSTDHGDLRVPHFLGMHALQLLPLLLLGIRKFRGRRNDALEVTSIAFAAATCAAIFLAALAQALAGLPLYPLTAS